TDSGGKTVVGTQVSLTYPYVWTLNRVIGLLAGATLSLPSTLTTSGVMQNFPLVVKGRQPMRLAISNASSKRDDEHGSTLVIVSGVMLVLLGVAALAVDLVTFYAVRAEAQRAADAAALGGAQMFITSGCTTGAGGCVAGGPQEAVATQRARDVG